MGVLGQICNWKRIKILKVCGEGGRAVEVCWVRDFKYGNRQVRFAAEVRWGYLCGAGRKMDRVVGVRVRGHCISQKRAHENLP